MRCFCQRAHNKYVPGYVPVRPITDESVSELPSSPDLLTSHRISLRRLRVQLHFMGFAFAPKCSAHYLYVRTMLIDLMPNYSRYSQPIYRQFHKIHSPLKSDWDEINEHWPGQVHVTRFLNLLFSNTAVRHLKLKTLQDQGEEKAAEKSKKVEYNWNSCSRKVE